MKTFGSAVYGVEAITITIEVNVSNGLHTFMVGLAGSAVKESIQRVESAIKSNGYYMPRTKLVVNLAPADIKKSGSSFDLPIALGVLGATGQIMGSALLEEYVMMGELGLDGSIHAIKGALPIAIQVYRERFSGLIIPYQNAREAAIVSHLPIYPVRHIMDVIAFFNEPGNLANQLPDTPSQQGSDPTRTAIDPSQPGSGSPYLASPQSPSDTLPVPLPQSASPRHAVPLPYVKPAREAIHPAPTHPELDFSDVKGQEGTKRALEIAAAGGHNALLIGPPGAGKTMLAKRLPGILPPLSMNEALETTKVHSVAGKLPENGALIRERPFRSPHHTLSAMALVGGGSIPQPGEISLAHNGVLFLDELPEFKRSVLEVMRQPMEEGRVTISRARMSIDFPARFILLASMNPCPCGYYNHPARTCVCPPGTVQKYLNRISGPLLDRIDLHVEVVPVTFTTLSTRRQVEYSSDIRDRVITARELQARRFNNLANADSRDHRQDALQTPGRDHGNQPTIYCNAQMSSRMVSTICRLDSAGEKLLQAAMTKLHLSARAYDRILKVSRSIADLAGSEQIRPEHLAEAIQYRSLDREGWAG